MSSTTKFITAQVGAKLVTIALGSANSVGARKFSADMFGAVGALVKSLNWGYVLSVEFPELKQKWSASGSTIAQCTDKFFEELRYQNEQIAAQINTDQPPADLFDTEPTREEYELNNHEADKANW
jgi:hypothetical protein